MNTSITPTQPSNGHKPRPMIDLLVSIVIPSVILMKFSGDDALGASGALVMALAFPLAWGLLARRGYPAPDNRMVLTGPKVTPGAVL